MSSLFHNTYLIRHATDSKATPVVGASTSEVTRLSNKVLGAAKVLDLSEEDLQHAVSNTRSVTGQLVTSKTGSRTMQFVVQYRF